MPDQTPDPAALAQSLAALRAELDGIDDRLHDLLMQRAGVVERVGALGAKGRVALRPGREAGIIHRLLSRHHGNLPKRALPRIWRELFSATTAMQGPYVVAVADPGDPQDTHSGGHVALAREHFGGSTDLRIHSSPAQALADVASGAAIAAVLPMPQEQETLSQAWWTALMTRDTPRIHVVARLPFWSPRAEGATHARALVVSVAPPDPSPHDHTLIAMEVPEDLSRARITALFSDVGLKPLGMILRRDPHASLLLVDADGFVAEDDPRFSHFPATLRPIVLGAYAKPVDGETA